jgi:hypothetical protein
VWFKLACGRGWTAGGQCHIETSFFTAHGDHQGLTASAAHLPPEAAELARKSRARPRCNDGTALWMLLGAQREPR